MNDSDSLKPNTESKTHVEAAQFLTSQRDAILQSSLSGVFGTDQDGNCTFANAECAKILGYPNADALIGHSMHALIYGSKAEGANVQPSEYKTCEAFQRTAPAYFACETFWKSDGTSLRVECWTTPILRGDQAVGVVVNFKEAVGRREQDLNQSRTEQQLQQQIDAGRSKLAQVSERLSLALTRANIGLWDWDATTDEVYFSPTYKTQLGYSADAAFRDFDAWRSRLHPDDEKMALQRVEEYFAQKTTDYRSKFRMKCADGSYRWLLAQGNADFDSDGKPRRVMGVHIDITEQIASEHELQRLNEELAAANDALRESNFELQQFASVASHDLQAPLRGITGFAKCLQDDYQGKLDDLADDYINRIVNSATRMQRLISDLLQFSRVESRSEPYELTNMNDIFKDAVQLLESTIDAKHALVTSEDLPIVLGDPTQLCQLLQNLIDNGIKYHEGNLPRVHVSVKRDENDWVFSLKDNGIGIDPDYVERVFEIFRRLHTQAVYKGSGIGLALCRRIVDRHHGRIWAESEPGQGSTFSFTLPVNE